MVPCLVKLSPPLSLTVVYMPLMTSQLGSLLSEEEYQRRMVPCLVKLFSSPDRATRVKLLQQLETFVDHLQPGTVNDQVRQTYPGGGGGRTRRGEDRLGWELGWWGEMWTGWVQMMKCDTDGESEVERGR